MPAAYKPPFTLLEKYADVLVNFALGEKEGIVPGDVVQCLVPDVAKPLGLALHNQILKAGGHVLMRLLPTGFDKYYYDLASQEQLLFFPRKYLKARADLINHSIGIIADPKPQDLSRVDPTKIMAARDSQKEYRDWLTNKESSGNFTWTLGLWGTSAKAKLAGLSLKEYWQQISAACFLDTDDPVAEWRKVTKLQLSIKQKLNALRIASVHIQGDDADLHIRLGADRIWKGGANRNIPSFELFTSPDWRGTEGWIRFNQPLFRYGNILRGVEMHFERGLVTKASAAKGQRLLHAMLQSKNANKLGEFSLTDKRLSNITHFMAETLYDENMGGEQGNTHVAIGMAYRDCYRGNQATVSKAEWKKMGFNDSAEHTDIVSTTKRKVTATLTSGEQLVIYDNGQFVL